MYVLSADWVAEDYVVLLPLETSGVATLTLLPDRDPAEPLLVTDEISNCDPNSYTTVAAINKRRGLVMSYALKR